MPRVVLRRLPSLAIATLLAVQACGDRTGPSPASGAIRVTTSTSGPGPDADGYSVLVGDEPRGTIDPHGNRLITDLSPGSWTVRLGDVAGNCQVAGENPRAVTVRAGAEQAVAFAVACVTPPAIGTLQVDVATSGENPDPDGYTISVNGARHRVTVTASLVLDQAPVGAHTVALGGLADHCTVQGPTVHVLHVQRGATTRILFPVVCGPISVGPPL